MGRGRARFGGHFSARFLARGFLGFPGVPYLFLQVFSKFFSGFFRVYKVRFFHVVLRFP